jgi:hypothetical protein
VGPTGYGNSPYQSLCSFAGNALIISPECLISDGLLQASDCETDFPANMVDYDRVVPFKNRLIEKAWANFRAGERSDLRVSFEEFCAESAGWLEDYALFRALKFKYRGSYYVEWPAELVRRKPDALAGARRELASQVDQVRFAQFLLFRQAERLKEYAHSKGVARLATCLFLCLRTRATCGLTLNGFSWMNIVVQDSLPEFLRTTSVRKANCGAILFTTGMLFVRLDITGASSGCVRCWRMWI